MKVKNRLCNFGTGPVHYAHPAIKIFKTYSS